MNLIKGFLNTEDEEVITEENNYYLSNDIVLFEPKTFDDAQVMASTLKTGKSIVVNLHNMNKAASQRTIDFISGVCYSLDGEIKKVSHDLILCTPRNIKVGGNIGLGD